jgi:hypothetical protein
VPLLLAALAVGAVLPASPFGAMLGFQPLPGLFFLALVVMVVAYLLLIELGKYWFYRSSRAPTAAPPRRPGPGPPPSCASPRRPLHQPPPTAVATAIEPKDPRRRDLGP